MTEDGSEAYHLEETISEQTSRIATLEAEIAEIKQTRDAHYDQGQLWLDDLLAAKREIAEKDARIAGLVEALTFYANPETYGLHPHGLAYDDRDLSYRARAALSIPEGDSADE